MNPPIMNFWKGNIRGVMSSRLMGRLWSFKLRSLVVGTVNGASTSFFSTRNNQKNPQKNIPPNFIMLLFQFQSESKKTMRRSWIPQIPQETSLSFVSQTVGLIWPADQLPLEGWARSFTWYGLKSGTSCQRPGVCGRYKNVGELGLMRVFDEIKIGICNYILYIYTCFGGTSSVCVERESE